MTFDPDDADQKERCVSDWVQTHLQVDMVATPPATRLMDGCVFGCVFDLCL